MKVLVIGGGGREHAVCLALSKSPEVTALYCAPGNGGTEALCQNVSIKATDIDGILAFAEAEGIGFVVITPEDPMALGLKDRLSAIGIPAFGHVAAAAMLESSKAFAKVFMQRHGIKTAKSEIVDDPQKAQEYVQSCPLPVVVKADGLAAGKGVSICHTRQSAVQAVLEMTEQNRFGKAGSTIVFEEFLTGPEVSCMCFTDGETIVPMPAAQDHKRALDGDFGPNTGGMGAFSPVSCFSDDMQARCMEEIFLPTLKGMKAEGLPLCGVIYFSLMLTEKGPYVIEYNMRFGDPETQVILPLLKTDLFSIMQACVSGTLRSVPMHWLEMSSCCVVIASGGYPGAVETGKKISGLGLAQSDDITVCHAGTKREGDGYVTAGGRVLNVTALAPSLRGAITKAYSAVSRISFDGAFYRKDIGAKDEGASL